MSAAAMAASSLLFPGLPGLAGLPGLPGAGLPPGFPNPLQLAAAAAASQPPSPAAVGLGSPGFNPLGLPFPPAGTPPGLAGARRK